MYEEGGRPWTCNGALLHPDWNMPGVYALEQHLQHGLRPTGSAVHMACTPLPETSKVSDHLNILRAMLVLHISTNCAASFAVVAHCVPAVPATRTTAQLASQPGSTPTSCGGWQVSAWAVISSVYDGQPLVVLVVSVWLTAAVTLPLHQECSATTDQCEPCMTALDQLQDAAYTVSSTSRIVARPHSAMMMAAVGVTAAA